MSDASNPSDDDMNAGTVVQGTAVFSKFMTVLQAVSDAPVPPDMAALRQTLPYPRGTLHRIVAALLAEGMVEEVRPGGPLRLGPRLIALAARSWERSDLRALAGPHLQHLRDETGETVHLAVPSGGDAMVYIDKLESPRTVRMTSRIGTRVDLHSTAVGKAYLAAFSRDERERMVARLDLPAHTPNTHTSRTSLLADVETTSVRGYARDDEENELEIRCFGAAVADRTGRVVGCVSISIPVYRFDAAEAEKVIAALGAAVARISAAAATII